MRPLALAVLMVCAFGCGRSGGGNGFGTDNEGIQNNGVGANGCVAPSSQGYTDSRDALDHGATGDLCDFGGGSGNGTQIDFCMGHYLFVESLSSADFAFCTPDGGSWPPTPVVFPGGCVESCFSSGGAMTNCLPQPVPAPTRQLPGQWFLTSAGGCDALMSGCPQPGDPCSGSTVCSGLWHPDQSSQATSWSGEHATMWCENGALQVVVTL